MYLIIILLVLGYVTGLTASVYYWVVTDRWLRCSYSEDEDYVCALLWFVYWPIQWVLLAIAVPFTLAVNLGKHHRKGKKK